ncbi:M56 family metallopeptidase [Dermacoccaceae bacterium W4C1]
MELAALVVIAAVTAVSPRFLRRQTWLRSVPVPALGLWQSTSTASLIAGLGAAPAVAVHAVHTGTALSSTEVAALTLALAMTVFCIAQLLRTGHRTGTSLRRARREHRELVDLLGPAGEGDDAGEGVRVLPHPTPTAYCLPGLHSRVVLSEGTLQRLDEAQLSAVLAHERAHLRYRHDLILEFFTVIHTAVPERVRSDAGLAEVRLLLELHADRVALRNHRPRDLGTALVSLAEGVRPAAGLAAAAESQTAAAARIAQLRDRRSHRLLAVAVGVAAALILFAPVGVIVAALA